MDVTWQSGPLESWFDIHEAIRKEFPRLRKMADDTDLGDTNGLKRLSDEVVFFAEVLTVHSLSEDGVGFPIMRSRGISVPESLSEDHHRELTAIYDIRRSCLELLFHEEGQDVAPALDRVRQQLAALETDLNAHITTEDDVIIPQAMALFSPQEQAHLVVRMVAHTPAWLSETVLPWMIESISREHRVHLLKVWVDNMPPEALREKVGVIRAGVSPDTWRDLVEGVPGIGKAGG
ncbi:MAG: hemerythrin domain-containing protein [Pseudomonadota bacterium]